MFNEADPDPNYHAIERRPRSAASSRGSCLFSAVTGINAAAQHERERRPNRANLRRFPQIQRLNHFPGTINAN